ncbi:hypothetical protein L914_19370 [Phytophthora nicotianae]|uniref:Uncharacterized protein n=1 Tax=Phytophthora nicotianae TaxID=4792 RepID=W2MAK6_PHYNI|nr:hypothetical protein L914_19370 [Phytophthora nicotianae]
MDVQLIGNTYGAAEYTAAYVSKAKPDTVCFKKQMQLCRSEKLVHRKYISFYYESCHCMESRGQSNE